MKFPRPIFLILLIGFLLYGKSLSFDYTNFDDNTLIQENQKFISDISNISAAFGKTVFLNGSDMFYRPMETIWFILNAQIGGENLFIYHLSSLLLHCLAVYLIFILLKRLKNSEETSIFLSLIFLVHPIFSQAIAWVPGVVDILVTIFSLSAFLFFLDFIQTQQRKFYVLHVLFFTLALFTKEIGICIILVCLIYLHFILKEKIISYNKKVLLIGWIIVCVIWFMMRSFVLRNQQQIGIREMLFSSIENFPGIIQYIGKLLLPFNLSVMPDLKDTTFIFGIIAIIIIIAVFFISKEKRNNWILFSCAWFLFFILPTFISTSEFRIQQFYEHRLYLPSVGFLFLIAETDFIRNFSIKKISHLIVSVSILLFFFILTFINENVFSDTKSFLDNAVSTSPSSSLAHRNLGIYYQDMDDKTNHKDKIFLQNAETEYKKSLELNPHEKDLRNNLGVIYDRWNKKDLAEKEYLTEVQLNPNNSLSLHNLGVICAARNENEKAETYFKKAIELNPNVSTFQQLALLYKKIGKEKEYENIVELLSKNKNNSSSNSQPFASPSQISNDAVSTGRHLLEQGKVSEAEDVFRKELMRDSTNTKVLFNLGLIYYSEKNLPNAESLWRKALTIDSTYTDAFNNLAICLAQQGKNSEAEVVMKKLIASNPDYADGYFNLANFYARNKREKDAMIYINLLKKKGITKEQFQQRGIKLSDEMEKLFDEK